MSFYVNPGKKFLERRSSKKGLLKKNPWMKSPVEKKSPEKNSWDETFPGMKVQVKTGSRKSCPRKNVGWALSLCEVVRWDQSIKSEIFSTFLGQFSRHYFNKERFFGDHFKRDLFAWGCFFQGPFYADFFSACCFTYV